MLGKLINALRDILSTGTAGRPWTPGASDLAYSTGLPIAVCDAALRYLGDDLAPFVLAHRRAEIEAVIGDTLTGSEREIEAAFAEGFFDDPAPGCTVEEEERSMIVTTGEPPRMMTAMSRVFVLMVNGKRFGAIFREREDAAKISWYLYRQAMESEVSDDDSASAEYKRALANAAK